MQHHQMSFYETSIPHLSRLKNLLLGGGITSSELDTELSDPATLGAYKSVLSLPFEKNILYTDPTAFDIILGSGTAFGLLEDADIVAALQDASNSDTRATNSNVFELTVVLEQPTAMLQRRHWFWRRQ